MKNVRASISKCVLSVLLCLVMLIGSTLPAQGASFSTNFKFVLLSDFSHTLDIGDQFYLAAITSNGKKPTFRSSCSSVASVNTYGKITAKKAGTAVITAKISGAEASCKITVRKTSIKLNKSSVSMENGKSIRLTAKTSNGSKVKWKVDKKSIVSINENGVVTAKKPGTATITATADKTSVTCRITVKKPTVQLKSTSLTLHSGQWYPFTATVSSGKSPTWKSSKKSIAVIDDTGMIYAVKPGVTVITAKVDGVEKNCIVTVEK